MIIASGADTHQLNRLMARSGLSNIICLLKLPWLILHSSRPRSMHMAPVVGDVADDLNSVHHQLEMARWSRVGGGGHGLWCV